MNSPETPEDVFVTLMDYIDDMELYGRNPKAFKEYTHMTLKQRTNEMRAYFARIPRDKWLDIHRLFMFAPDLLELVEGLCDIRDYKDASLLKSKASTLLELIRSWTEPPFLAK